LRFVFLSEWETLFPVWVCLSQMMHRAILLQTSLGAVLRTAKAKSFKG